MTKFFYNGDITVQLNKIDTYPQTGMSQVLHLYMGDHVQVMPHGKNGRSTKSFLEEGLFESVRWGMGPGDFLLIQFGHNDEKADKLRHTDPFGSYQENLMHYIRAARAVGAHPVLVTPIARRLFDTDGNFLPGSHGDYPEAARQLGMREDVPVADLTALSEAMLEKLGDEKSKPLFVWPVDNTHLKYDGAVRMAGLLARELERFGGVYGALLHQAGGKDPVAELDCL